MTQLATVSQGQFLRGLNAVAGRLAQPKGSVQAISNMMYSTRGSLQTVDGDDEIAFPYTGSPFAAVLGIGNSPGFSNSAGASVTPRGAAAVIEFQVHISSPSTVTAVAATTAGGVISTGSYTIAVAPWDGNGGIGIKGANIPVTISGSQNSISFTWSNPLGLGQGIAVYWLNGSTWILAAILPGTSGVVLSLPLMGFAYSGTDTTESSQLAIIYPSYGVSSIFALPSSPVRKGGLLSVNPFSSVLPPSQALLSYSIPNGAAGGVLGGIGPLPQILNFSGIPITILGNTAVPMQCVLNASGTITAFQPLANHYVVAYPSWTASTLYSEGTVVQPSTPNGFWYTAAQGGQSGATEPTFPSSGNVSDGSVIWEFGGSTSIVAPRGAAHAINHASCLFMLNTSPIETSDGLDGPSVLAQSDVNNPNSWNPVNRTTIGKGDGQNGMGLASFSIAEAGIAPQLTLFIFKEFSTYVMTGLLPNATITAVQTDMGCVAPRSIQFVEGIGVIRLTHKGFAATDGIGDKIISDEIRPYILKNSQGVIPNDQLTGCLAQSFQTVDPPMYCCSLSTAQNNPMTTSATLQFNRLACFDTKLRCWTIVDLPFNIFAMGLIQTTNLFSDSIPCFGSLTDGSVHRWMNNDAKWDIGSQGTPISWSVTMPPVTKDGTTRLFVDNILIAGSSMDGPVSVKVQVFEQGNQDSSPNTVSPQISQQFSFSTPGQFQCSVRVGKTVQNSWISLSGQGRVIIDTVNWSVRPKTAGVPASMMAS